MKKYLLLAIIGLVGASLQTMERDPRKMEQLRNQRARFEQQERKLADFENFLRNEWLTIRQLNDAPWFGSFDKNPGFITLAERAFSKAKEWKIDLDTVKRIFSKVIFDIMIMKKYGVQEGTLEFANSKALELKKIEKEKAMYQQVGENYPGPSAFYTNQILNNIAGR